jgi:hypothetical protein
MGRRDVISVELVDVSGSFARFLRDAPKEMRIEVIDAVKKTCFSMSRRMEATAEVGPDAPHIRDHVTYEMRGLTGKVGFINATQSAGPNNDATMADVALFNEFNPNKQPFMRPAAEAESSDFAKRMKAAITQAERDLTGGGGLL